MTWGHESASNSSKVRDQLTNVRQIQATSSAFAAIREDGSVVTWGKPEKGGCSVLVQEQLTSVRQIQATNGAFAAIRSDATVIAWGHPADGGDSRFVQEELVGVQQIQAATGVFGSAFAAIREDGRVILGQTSNHTFDPVPLSNYGLCLVKGLVKL